MLIHPTVSWYSPSLVPALLYFLFNFLTQHLVSTCIYYHEKTFLVTFEYISCRLFSRKFPKLFSISSSQNDHYLSTSTAEVFNSLWQGIIQSLSITTVRNLPPLDSCQRTRTRQPMTLKANSLYEFSLCHNLVLVK